MTKNQHATAMIRAVKVLSPELRAKAKKMKLKDTDVVLIKKGTYHSEPDYELTKVEGSIVEFYRKNGILIND